MEWFRYYTNTLDKHKIQSLPPATFKEWVNMLAVARKHDGVLPDVDQVAWDLHTSAVRAAGMIERLISCKLFDRDAEGTVKPHDWEEWQRSSDDAAQRKRDQRERDRVRAVSQAKSQPKSQKVSQDSPVLEQIQRQNRDRTEQTTAPPLSVTEWPLATDAVCSEFTAADSALLLQIIQVAAQSCADAGLNLTDPILAQAVHEARKQAPEQYNAALYLTTIPKVIRNWAREARRRNGK